MDTGGCEYAPVASGVASDAQSLVVMDIESYNGHGVQGYLAHKKQSPPSGPPEGPRHSPTAGS